MTASLSASRCKMLKPRITSKLPSGAAKLVISARSKVTLPVPAAAALARAMSSMAWEKSMAVMCRT
ncbi:hypothetical protein D3C87_1827530 [compost metagenome]